MIKNIDEFNFIHNGYKIKFCRKPNTADDIDIFITKGNTCKHLCLSDLIEIDLFYDVYSDKIIAIDVDRTEEYIKAFKAAVIKGELDLCQQK